MRTTASFNEVMEVAEALDAEFASRTTRAASTRSLLTTCVREDEAKRQIDRG